MNVKWSIRARLTVWFSLLMVAALTMFSVGVLWLHTRWAHQQFDTGISSLAATLSRVMQEEVNERNDLYIAAGEMHSTIEVADRATAILDATGKPIVANWHGFPQTAVRLTAIAREPLATVTGDGHAWRMLTRRESSAAGDYIILVAGDL
ncbi:MAG: hypothetical protein ABJC89_11525, partial [Acidobacteriota bacterium]